MTPRAEDQPVDSSYVQRLTDTVALLSGRVQRLEDRLNIIDDAAAQKRHDLRNAMQTMFTSSEQSLLVLRERVLTIEVERRNEREQGHKRETNWAQILIGVLLALVGAAAMVGFEKMLGIR